MRELKKSTLTGITPLAIELDCSLRTQMDQGNFSSRTYGLLAYFYAVPNSLAIIYFCYQDQ